MPFDLISGGDKKKISILRDEFPELIERSDYVCRTVAYVINALTIKHSNPNNIPDFVGAPVGAGKTTGAILGLAKLFYENPDFRAVLLVPFIDQAEAVYRQLVKKVGTANVCVWTSKHNIGADSGFTQRFGKNEVTNYPLVVVCHQAVNNPAYAGFLGKRDLWVYDEMPENIRPTSLHLGFFAESWTWTEQVGDPKMVSAAKSAHAWATLIQDSIAQNYEAVAGMPWVEKIAGWDMAQYRNTPLTSAVVNELVHWCRAVHAGFGFVSRKTFGTSKVVTFNGALCQLPDASRTVILSASAWVSGYHIAPDRYSRSVEHNLPQTDYPELMLVHLDPPKGLPRYYKTYAKSRSTRDKVTKYLQKLLDGIPDERIFLTCPKPIQLIVQDALKGCDKQVSVSHHGIGTGSNDWRDCTAVIYFLDHYIPAEAHVSRKHAIVGDQITEDSLSDAQHYLRGQYADVKIGHHMANMMQLVGRGRVRVRDDDGRSMPMTAYMIVRRDLFDRMQSIYPNAQMNYRSEKPKTRHKMINKIADWLRDHADGDIPASVVDVALSTRCRRWTKQLAEDKGGILAGAGYCFIAGRKGRGESEGRFTLMS